MCQALETQLESGQRSGRSNQLSAQSQEERLRQEVASESAAIAAINTRVNGLMQDLQVRMRGGFDWRGGGSHNRLQVTSFLSVPGIKTVVNVIADLRVPCAAPRPARSPHFKTLDC